MALLEIFSKKKWRHLLSNPDVLGVGPISDNNFQPIDSFVSLAMLGDEIVVRLTSLTHGWNHVTC